MTSVQLVGPVLTVRCDDTDSTVLVTQNAGGLQVKDVMANRAWNFTLAQVGRVDVFGGAGDDTFTGRGYMGIRLRMYGGDGNDTMYGNPGRDVLVGGAGNDHLYGRGGNDFIEADAGDDWVDGGAGNDIIDGGDGNDQLIGGLGTDAVSGDNGDDTIVSIDAAATDRVDGGPGADTLWIDGSAAGADQQTGVDGLDTVHTVAAFANGADLTLNGDRIALPTTLNGETYETFAGLPLFAAAGPTVDDVVQQVSATTQNPVLDDGWLLSALGAIADVNPTKVEQNVVDFGDGTYGVDLGGTFYRVDNRLPVSPLPGSVTPAYAGFGQENSLWVPIVEKAFAAYRSGANSYASLNGTGGATPAGTPEDVFTAFGYGANGFLLNRFTSPTQLGSVIKAAVDRGFPTAVDVGTPGGTAPLIAGQAYTLTGYQTDAFGDVSSVTLRNPEGFDGGDSTDADPLDGIVTVSINDLYATTGSLQFGSF